MQTNKVFKLGMAVLFTLTLAACASTDTEESGGSDGSDSSGNSSTGNNGNGGGGSATSSGTGSNAGLTPLQIRERDQAMDTNVFYFEFDRSDLSAEARAALVHHANYLKETPSARYRLEGHADERGTREYNLALGERRSQAVERYLQVQGVSSGQLETISYGEENPVDSGSSDSAYSRNRRVEIH
jgi:peptidoglycan-associated lipoprotein